MSVDPHVHCASCQTVIETTIRCRDGKTKDRKINVVGQPTVTPTPDGLAVVNRPVALCDECFAKVTPQEPSRIVVPGRGRAL